MALERVQKLIAKSGYCSRRKAEELIEAGRVTVNDMPITLGDKADPVADTVKVDGKKAEYEQKKYFMLHKPKGFITTVDDMYDRKTVMHLIEGETRLFPVGRLDRDATGLLLMTNDGDFANRISHPRSEVQKTYVAVLTEPFNEEDIKKLTSPVKLDGKRVKADQAVVLAEDTVALTIHVGLNKIVKRLFKEHGYYVKHLHRTHIGSLALDVLEGEHRPLSEDDKKAIFSPLELTPETFS